MKVKGLVLLLVLLLLPSCFLIPSSPLNNGSLDTAEEVDVVRVVDGDTIKVRASDGHEYTVRYIGIDTPETVHPSKPVEYMGVEASDRNKELVEGKIVYLEFDVEARDKYDRLLAYIWLVNYFDDVNDMVNYLLVREGFANVSTYPPNVKYTYQFLKAEKYARDNDLGLWS